MAALSSEQKLPKFLDRCMNGTPRIQLDVHRINRLASLGPPRRVPSFEGEDNAAANHPSNDICTKQSSPVLENAPARSPNLLVTRYAPVDSVEVRKRKADRDASSGQEHAYLKHAEGRPNPNSRIQLNIFADLKNRKPIELAKDLFDIQDKENINPCSDNPRKDARKQTNELSDEKRRLQVSKKLQHGQGGRKVGSLLMKQSVGCFRSHVGSQPTAVTYDICGEKGNAQEIGLDYVTAHSKADDKLNKMQLSALNPSPAVQQLDDIAQSTSDSMSISQPLQLGSHSDNAQLVYGQASSTLVEQSCQSDAVSASVRELSCSMSTLVICGEIVHNPSEKAKLQAEVAVLKDSLVAIDPKSNAQICSGAACPALPPASAPYTSMSACSIAVRTASAPLATSSSLTQQSTGRKGQSSSSLGSLEPLSKHSPVLGIESLKSSQTNLATLPSSNGQVKRLHKEERQLSSKGSLLGNGALKTGLDKASEVEPISEAGAMKVVSHMHASSAQEKKPASSGDASLQVKKHGETEYIVWVNGKRYQKIKKIGRGGSSDVYKVVDRECNMYALKRIKLKGRDYSTACGFYQEIEYLNKLHGNRYIIRLIDHEITEKNLFSCDYDPSHVIRDDVYIYMVLEYGEIDLANMLDEKLKERAFGNDEVDETWLRFYWQQILEAVNTIHEERIVHSDLKPANFLLVKGVLKLIDFGIAKSIQSDTTNIERDAQVGTLNYMSPEAFLMNEKDEHGQVIKCGRPSDIWSLGCILYQMVYGKTPFAHITKLHAKIQEVANPNHKIAFPTLLNPYLTDIMKSCLAWKKEERLRIPQLLNHPFLQPHLASLTCSTDPKGALLQLRKEHSQDEEVRILTEQLLERLNLFNNAMDI